MNVYFSCSITGGRNEQNVYQLLVESLLQDGHEVPTAHLSNKDIMTMEAIVSAEEIYQRDVDWVRGCDALVAEVSTPSHGVGYEIALAEMLGKPVFCCYARGKRVSKMILGNHARNFCVIEYQSADEAVCHMREFLKNVTRL
jgi:nucleoside 2-deoxyribosyltransferase